MNFFKIILITLFAFVSSLTLAIADNHDQKKEVLEQVKEIAKEIEDDEEVPLNDPFAGDCKTMDLK